MCRRRLVLQQQASLNQQEVPLQFAAPTAAIDSWSSTRVVVGEEQLSEEEEQGMAPEDASIEGGRRQTLHVSLVCDPDTVTGAAA